MDGMAWELTHGQEGRMANEPDPIPQNSLCMRSVSRPHNRELVAELDGGEDSSLATKPELRPDYDELETKLAAL